MILGTAVVGTDALGDLCGYGVGFLLSSCQAGQQRQDKELGHKAGSHRVAGQADQRFAARFSHDGGFARGENSLGQCSNSGGKCAQVNFGLRGYKCCLAGC